MFRQAKGSDAVDDDNVRIDRMRLCFHFIHILRSQKPDMIMYRGKQAICPRPDLRAALFSCCVQYLQPFLRVFLRQLKEA